MLPHTCQNGYYQKDNKVTAGKDVKKGEPSCTVGWMSIDAATKENPMEIPQRIKNRTSMWSSNSTTGYLSKKKKKKTLFRKDICTPMFTDTFIYNIWDMNAT